MLPKIIGVLIVLAGLINFAPVVGVLSADRISSLYGVDVDEPNVTILLRHRALLFGLLGGFMIVSAFVPSLQVAAFVVGFGSMIGYMLLAFQTGGFNDALRRVVVADGVAIAFLAAAAALYVVNARVS